MRQADPLTILHVTAPAVVGGLESVVLALASGHQRRGHRVHVVGVVTPDQPVPPLFERLSAAGVAVHPVVVPARSYIDERAAVQSLCRSLRPDVFHTHGYRSDVADGGIARRLNIPTVSTVHGFISGGRKGRFYEWWQRRALRRYDAVVAVSEPQVRLLSESGIRADRIQLIRNAWAGSGELASREEARRQFGTSASAFHIGWVGRLSTEKGADVLIEALAKLTDIDFEASILGDGPLRGMLHERAQALGIGDRMRWRGLVADAERLYPAFDVFVLSSRTEGTPIALLEAMAAGVPIVATAVGGVPGVVSDSEALIVPAENPAALAAAIRNVNEQPAEARHRAFAARERLQQEFAVEPWLSRYESLYYTLRSPSNVGRSS